MKKMIILLTTVIGIYLIYSINSKTLNYVLITDSIMYNNFSNEYNNYFTNSTINNMYHDIKNNRTITINNKTYYLKKTLRESDVLIISIGMEEIINNYNIYDGFNDDYLNKMYLDITNLVNEIKKYAYGRVLFFGYYNPTNYYDASIDNVFYKINKQLEKLLNDNNIIYIDLYELVKNNNLKGNSYFLNEQGKITIHNIINFYLDLYKISAII